MEQNRWTSDIGGRFHKRITGAQQTQKEPLLLTAEPAEREARAVILRGYIAGEHSERSPPSIYIYIYICISDAQWLSRNTSIGDLGSLENMSRIENTVPATVSR